MSKDDILQLLSAADEPTLASIKDFIAERQANQRREGRDEEYDDTSSSFEYHLLIGAIVGAIIGGVERVTVEIVEWRVGGPSGTIRNLVHVAMIATCIFDAVVMENWMHRKVSRVLRRIWWRW